MRQEKENKYKKERKKKERKKEENVQKCFWEWKEEESKEYQSNIEMNCSETQS